MFPTKYFLVSDPVLSDHELGLGVSWQRLRLYEGTTRRESLELVKTKRKLKIDRDWEVVVVLSPVHC